MGCLLIPVLLSLLTLGACQKTELRVAFAYFSATTDFSWTWRANQGRIYMVGQLLDLYPGLTVQTYYHENMDDNAMPPNCPPQFEAWAQQKMDIIFGTSYGFQYCMASLAPKYPDTLWFPLLGDLNLTLPNWGLGVGNIHQTMFLAGMVAGKETKTGKVGACMPIAIPQTYAHLAAFALGVAYANASVQVVTAWTNQWQTPNRDVFMVQRMVADNIDIIWHRCGTMEGVNEAEALGVRSIGFNSDFTMLAGESVLISPYYNWGVLFLQVARMVVDGNYTQALPVDLFPGLEVGAVGLSDPSYLVRKTTMTQVLAVEAAIRAGTNNTFCGPMLTNTGKVVGQAGSCLTEDDLRVLTWEPWNVLDRGHFALPDEVCYPGEQSHWDNANEKYYCTVCPAGTYSTLISNVTYQAFVCQPCPANTYSASNATGCASCPAGNAVTARQDGCAAIPLSTGEVVGIAVGSAAGGLFLAILVYCGWRMWRATADLRKLRKQFSNNNVAQECAEAIACFNLESVAWLRTCQNPNKIQQSFLQILEMMTMVKPYIPDHVLSIFTQRQQNPECPELVLPGSPEKSMERIGEGPTLPRVSSDISNAVIKVRCTSPAVKGRKGSDSEESTTSSRSPRSRKARGSVMHADPRLLPSAGDWVPKRCTYMVVTVSFVSPGGEGEEEDDRNLPLVGQVLGDVVGVGKSFAATIDHVTCDRVAMHWGLVGSVSEGALKATQAALEMGKIRSRLLFPWRSLLRLSVSVVQGVCNVTTISAAGHSFFVVGGALLRQVNRLTAKGLAGKCQCDVLISESVHGQVQYAVECMPRCFLGKVLFWQPLKLRAADGVPVDEWMYELHQMEADQVDKWCSRSLFNVFQAAAQADDSGALRSEIAKLREKFKAQMSAQDEACLDLLLAEGGRCGA
eukprot:EG_transcript_1650